jgi:phosphonate transport system substrate-binding protein
MRFVFSAVRALLNSLVCALLICILVVAVKPVYAVEEPQELLLGIEPEHNIFDQMERYLVLADYLTEQLGVKVKLTIMSRYGEVIKRFKTLKLDGAFLTPYTATLGIRELNLEPLVNPVNLDGEFTTQGYIFVRKDSGIHSIADMEGGSIVFVDPATMEGYLFPLVFLHQHGVTDISKFYSRYYFSGSHASAIFAVLDGRADIGAAKSTVYNRLVKNDPSIAQDLDIIAKSVKVPEITLCIRSEIAPELRDKLTEILLQMDETPEGMKVLKQFKARGFIKAEKKNYAVIEDMAMKALGSLTVHGR